MSRSPAVPLTALLVLALSACKSIAPHPPGPSATSSVYVVRRAWHIDIGFAAGELRPPLRVLLQAFPPATYLEFGFGDRHYLTTRDHGTATLLSAVWPGASLILMTALKATPQEAFGTQNVVVLRITAAQSQAVQAFIWDSLSHDAAAKASAVAEGPYPGSVFYAATPWYSGLHTCNTWAAESLQSAGLPVHSTGVVFSRQLWSQVRRLNRQAP
jgi:uncharacterized protein (TIGR02117 family)